MSHYTNPAFCQKSEFYPQNISLNENDDFNKPTQSEFLSIAARDALVFRSQNLGIRAHKSQQQINQRQLPPKPGPKAIKFNINTEYPLKEALPQYRNSETKTQHNGYALVPLDELPTTSKDRYAILPASQAHIMHSNSLRLSKSQDNLDIDFTESAYEEEDSFTSLPVFTTLVDNRKLIPAFSSDFINNTFGSSEQNGTQRYTIVPTDDDEDLVDSNHEIIEMCNGRAHRYAVIPADDNERYRPVECGVRPSKLSKSQSFDVGSIQKKIIRYETPSKTNENGCSAPATDRHANPSLNIKTHTPTLASQSMKEIPNTPTKNLNATQKLHELLSTPRKGGTERLQRCGSYQTIIQRSPNQIQLHQLDTTQNRTEFIPQKLKYESRTTLSQNIEHRTTAVISPRLHQQMAFSDANDKQWSHESFQKVENATATIGIISLMLILTGILNSGLCLYMVTDVSLK